MKKVLFVLAVCLLAMNFAACNGSYDRVTDDVSNSFVETEHIETAAIEPSTGEPYYLVTLKIKQSTFTLDIGEHIKNKMNAVEMTIAVDKRFYDKVKVGQEISNSFKTGSLLFNGDFSNLKVTVVNKQIKK